MNEPLRRQGCYALAAVCLSALMLGLEISSVPPILPTLERQMQASFSQLQWIMAAYTIAMTSILMAVGTLADRYGRRRLFHIGIVAFGLTSLACGLAASAPLLIAARFLQGLGAALMLICMLAILASQFRDGRERATAFAWWGVVFGVGLGFGPIVGGAILALAGWPWVFLVHGVLAVVTLGLSRAGVQESRDGGAGRLDIAGMLTLSAAVFCLVLFVTQGPVLGFGSAAALSILGLSVAGFAGFVLAETRSAHPMVEFSMFGNRRFSGALLGSMGMNFSFWPFIVYLPIYFHAVRGYDGLQTGLALLAYTLPTLFVPPLAERLSLRYQPGVVIPAGLATIGLGFALMWAGTAPAQPAALLIAGCVVAGLGLGLTNTPVSNTSTAAVPAERAGMASGADMSARMVSLTLNIAIMGFILLEGVLAALRNGLGAAPGQDAAALRAMAEKIASGDVAAMPPAGLQPGQMAEALAAGFGAVTAYGAASAFVLALACLWVFAPGRAPRPVACAQAGGCKA